MATCKSCHQRFTVAGLPTPPPPPKPPPIQPATEKIAPTAEEETTKTREWNAQALALFNTCLIVAAMIGYLIYRQVTGSVSSPTVAVGSPALTVDANSSESTPPVTDDADATASDADTVYFADLMTAESYPAAIELILNENPHWRKINSEHIWYEYSQNEPGFRVDATVKVVVMTRRACVASVTCCITVNTTVYPAEDTLRPLRTYAIAIARNLLGLEVPLVCFSASADDLASNTEFASLPNGDIFSFGCSSPHQSETTQTVAGIGFTQRTSTTAVAVNVTSEKVADGEAYSSRAFLRQLSHAASRAALE